MPHDASPLPRSKRSRPTSRAGPSAPRTEVPSLAYIQAYEAQISYAAPPRTQNITWTSEDGEAHVQTDRHDMIHLLSSLPSTTPGPGASRRSSSSSWDSLSDTDAEERFHLSGSEEEAFDRAKQKRRLEDLRETRLRDLAAQKPVAPPSPSSVPPTDPRRWEKDESPPPAIATLMSHTARALSASPNPKVLEMRIVTHHSTDTKFEFIRGRYADSWARVKEAVRKERLRKESAAIGVGGLVGGYESESEDGDDDRTHDTPPPPPDEDLPLPPDDDPPVEDQVGPPTAVVDTAPTSIHTPPPIVTDSLPSPSRSEEVKRLCRLRAEEWKKSRGIAK
ncbi:hypothetical protein P7C73_g4606, partial [Tremellales sp. Uapishka_1]